MAAENASDASDYDYAAIASMRPRRMAAENMPALYSSKRLCESLQ